jgi:parallel beta-helix repeat protein
MVRKRILVLLVAVAMVLSQPLALFGVNEDVTQVEGSMVGETFEPQELSQEIPLADFSGRFGEWSRVAHVAYPAIPSPEQPTPPLVLRASSDGHMLYTIVEGADRDTRNVYYISIAGRAGGFTFMGRPNVHYVVANGFLYRVLNGMSEYRSEYAAPAQVGATSAADQMRVWTQMPEWFGADDDPNRDAQRLERVNMEYFRNWTGMNLRLEQIGNPDPADISISWRGMTGGVQGNTTTARQGHPVHLPANTGTMLNVAVDFERNRAEGVYFPNEDFSVIFNPLRGGGSNLQSSEEPDCTCPPDQPCIASLIHTQPDGSPLVITDGPVDGQLYGYAYITWRSLEPESGLFDWDNVRMYTKGDYPVVGPNMDQYQCARGFLVTRALEEYARQGVYVQLRFVMDYPFGSPFGYWYGDNYIGGTFDNDPQRHLGYRRSHTELAMINLRNERIADIPTWLIERMRSEPNRPNPNCPDNIPNRPDFDPGDGLFQRMRNPEDANFYFWAQRFLTGYFHCAIPSPHSSSPGDDLRTCENGCVPYRRPVGLQTSFANNAVGQAQQAHGWHHDYFWGPEGTWYLTPPPDISGGVGLGPRYEHHLLLQYHERAIHALANEIAREGSVWNAVANVQFGSLGRWGEWHNWPAAHTGTFPDSALAYRFVRHYIEAFAGNDNIQFGMRYPNWILTRYNMGTFNDQTGHSNQWNYVNAFAGQNLAGNNAASLENLGGWPGHGTVTTISSGNDNANMGGWNRNDAHLSTGFANAAGFLEAIRHPTHWMHGWVGGEYGDVSVPTNFFWQYVQFDVSRQGDLHRASMHDYGRDSTAWGNANGIHRVHIMNTVDVFRWAHVSNLAPRGPNAGRTNATTGDMQRAHKNNDAAYDNMGYQFFVEEVEIVDGELERGESVDVRMVVNNIGVAPFYRDWPFEVSFIDNFGNVAHTQIIDDIDIRTWMPRHRPINNARPEPDSICAITGVPYRSVAQLSSTAGRIAIPAHDGRNEVVFTVDVPANLSENLEFTMAVAILDPLLLNMNPGINWHNTESRDDRRLPLTPFTVGNGRNEFFVAMDGNNAVVDGIPVNDGSIEEPWASVAFAMTQMNPGDTLTIRGGVYSEAITVPARLSGYSVPRPCNNDFNFHTGGCIYGCEGALSDTAVCTLNEYGNTVFRAYPGETPIFRRDATGGDAFRFNNVDNLTLEGLSFQGFGGGIRHSGSVARPATGLENVYIRNNTVSYNRAGNSINIYNQASNVNNMSSMRNVVIEGNHVHDGRSGWTETVVVNGNVNGIRIFNNLVHNNNNIAIDLIGWETNNNLLLDPANPGAGFFEDNRTRNILVHDNVIHGTQVINGHQTYRRAHSMWGFPPQPLGNYDPCSVGIYFDSGTQGRIFNNFIFDNDIGISISSERIRGNIHQIRHPVTEAILPPFPLNDSAGMSNSARPWYLTNVHVHDNIIATTQGEGAISIGGYSADRTETFDIIIENNILFNDRWAFLIQNSHDNTIRNNIIVSEQMELGYGSRQGAGRFLPWPSFPSPTTANPGGDFWNFSRLPQPWTDRDGKVGRNYLELPGANDFGENFWFSDDPEFYFNGPTTFSLMTMESDGFEAAMELGGFFDRMRAISPEQYERQRILAANPLVDPAGGNFDFTAAFSAEFPNAGTDWRPEDWALELFAESFEARIEVEAARQWLENNRFNLLTDIVDEGYTTLNEFLNARLQEEGFLNTEILYTINAAPGHAHPASAGYGMYMYDGGHGAMAAVRGRELIRGLHAGWQNPNWTIEVGADNTHAAEQVPWRAGAPNAPNSILNGYIHADRVAALANALADGNTANLAWAIRERAMYREFAWEVQVVTRFGPNCDITGEPLHYVSAATYSCRYYGMDRVTGEGFTQALPNGGLRLYVGTWGEYILNRDELRTVLADATDLNQSNFSAANWRLFLPAYNHARNVYNNDNATQAEIDHATNTLRNLVIRAIN